jgi:hypothetical protein
VGHELFQVQRGRHPSSWKPLGTVGPGVVELRVDVFGVTQPRVSDLVRGRIDLFSINALVKMLARAGVRVRLVVKRSHRVA